MLSCRSDREQGYSYFGTQLSMVEYMRENIAGLWRSGEIGCMTGEGQAVTGREWKLKM